MSNYLKLIQNWEQAKSFPMRDRIKALRSLGFEAATLFSDEHETLTSEQILYLSKILSDMISIQSFGKNYAVIRNKMIAEYLNKSKVSEPHILLKKNIQRSSVDGMVYVIDASIKVDLFRDEEELIKSMNCHEAFYFDTDDKELELRIVECPEPILFLKEFKSVVASTFEPGIIHCPTGKLIIADSCNLSDETIIQIQPGFYKIAAYIIKKKSNYLCVIVVSKTKAPFKAKTTFDNLRDYY